jgi:hypothetical protein
VAVKTRAERNLRKTYPRSRRKALTVRLDGDPCGFVAAARAVGIYSYRSASTGSSFAAFTAG